MNFYAEFHITQHPSNVSFHPNFQRVKWYHPSTLAFTVKRELLRECRSPGMFAENCGGDEMLESGNRPGNFSRRIFTRFERKLLHDFKSDSTSIVSHRQGT